MKTINEFINIPRNYLVEDGRTENYRYLILDYNKGFEELYGYCGYVIFDENPIIDSRCQHEDGKLLKLIPVHGGINFSYKFEDGYIYGFSTDHFDSPKYPFRNIDWIKKQIHIMYLGITCIAKYEKRVINSKEYRNYMEAQKEYFELENRVMFYMKEALIYVYGNELWK